MKIKRILFQPSVLAPGTQLHTSVITLKEFTIKDHAGPVAVEAELLGAGVLVTAKSKDGKKTFMELYPWNVVQQISVEPAA